MSTSESPFGGQIFKQRNRVAGNTGSSTFDETSDEKLKIPDVDGVLGQIDKQLDKSKEIVIQPIREIKHSRPKGVYCWSSE